MLVSFLAMISNLHNLFLLPAVSIPIWDQYVGLVRWALDSLALLFHSGGLAIVAFTIIIKTILLPLTVQSTRSARAMQELQPKIKELQKKYSKDRQRLTQETMALYQQHRVNPMAGCLPMLLQLPIFFGLYQGIFSLSQGQVGASEFWSGPFLWLGDGLASPDPWHILPIIAGAFQFVQTRMMRPYKQGNVTDPQQKMMNQVMNIMPLTIIAFGWGFASGPVLYWATQSLYSVAQQWIITGWGSMRDWFEWLPELPEHRRLGYRSPRELEAVTVVTGEDGRPVPQGGVMGWLQRRMDDAQHQASARRGGAPAEAATNGAGGGETPAAAPSSVRVTGSSRGGRSGGKRGRGSGAKAAKPAATAQVIEAGANGQEAESATSSSSRAVIIPRKARSAHGDDGP